MSEREQNLLLDWALFYHSKGYLVIPLPHCSKIPAKGFTWEKWQKNRPDRDQLCEWFEGKPQQNIAIITGRVQPSGSGYRHYGGFKALEQYIPRGIVTPATKTPKGRHLYFQASGSTHRK